jgi:hypothetical protein
MEKWIEQKILWNPVDRSWDARLSQISFARASASMVSLDVDEGLFLNGLKVSYYPNDDPLYVAYKSLLEVFIKQVKPFIGVIDWDADLLCPNLEKNSFAAWGNYLSYRFLENWSKKEKEFIQEIVDEMSVIDDAGILIFNHPLGYSEADESPNKIWTLISAHINEMNDKLGSID